jgi:hypothetical protein
MRLEPLRALARSEVARPAQECPSPSRGAARARSDASRATPFAATPEGSKHPLLTSFRGNPPNTSLNDARSGVDKASGFLEPSGVVLSRVLTGACCRRSDHHHHGKRRGSRGRGSRDPLRRRRRRRPARVDHPTPDALNTQPSTLNPEP